MWLKISNNVFYDKLLEHQNRYINSNSEVSSTKVSDYTWRHSPSTNADAFQYLKDQSIQYILYVVYYMYMVRGLDDQVVSLSFPGCCLTDIEEYLLYQAFDNMKVIYEGGAITFVVEDPKPSFASDFYQATQAGMTDPLITFLTLKVHEFTSRGDITPDFATPTGYMMNKAYQFYHYQPFIATDLNEPSMQVCIRGGMLNFLPAWLDFEDLPTLSSCLDESSHFYAYVREVIGIGDRSKIDEIYLYRQRT